MIFSRYPRKRAREAANAASYSRTSPSRFPISCLRESRISAFVHHGGIGTMSQALRAGVPQLIRPMAHDQFDNANRAVRLGVAMKLLPRDYRVKNVVNALERLTDDAAMRARCTELAGNFRDDSVATACEHILKVLGPMATHAL